MKIWVEGRRTGYLPAKSVLNCFLFRHGSLQQGGQREAEYTNLWKNV